MRAFRRLLTLLAFLAIPALAVGCDVTGPSPEEEFVLHVAPYTVPCNGMGPQHCMLTRRSPTAEWTYFYDGIEGFAYEPGFDWTLRVRTREIRNPPADGSSIEYRLLEVIEKAPAAAEG
jgi:hypothetical protein